MILNHGYDTKLNNTEPLYNIILNEITLNHGKNCFRNWLTHISNCRCYTTDPKKRWEECPVPICAPATKDTCLSQCYDKDLDPQGAKYKGCVKTTVTGRTCQVKNISESFPNLIFYFCQAWASKTPHSHGHTSLEENHCRNPDGHTGAWLRNIKHCQRHNGPRN